jgi:hypothetical protein
LAAATLEGKSLKPGKPVKAFCIEIRVGPRYLTPLHLLSRSGFVLARQALGGAITRGQFRGVSEAKLLDLVARLGHDVKIVVGPTRRRAGKMNYAEV